jgi:lon-related putative ATP-dependent protease
MPTARERLVLQPEQLRHRLDPESLPFQTTAEVPPLADTIGQPRALEAIEFGLAITARGYNLFVAGAPGSGRESTILDVLAGYARTRPVAADWIYVYNFSDPDRPRAIGLPAGRGALFARAMAEFLSAAQREIPRAFDSEDYERRRQDALKEISGQRETLLGELRAFAEQRGFGVAMTTAGIVTVALREGQPLSEEDYARLRPEERQDLERRSSEVQSQLATTLRHVRQREKEAAERLRALEREVMLYALGPLLAELRDHTRDLPDLLAYLEQVQNDLPDHLADFRPAGAPETEPAAPLAPLSGLGRSDPLARYRVNVLIDQGGRNSAPVVVERNPTAYNLAGRIDYRTAFGAMVTDFQQIKPGALHQANGGYLVLHLLDVLRTPFVWEVLKRALASREVAIENLGDQYSPVPTASLRPVPIPLDVKVILIGPAELYHLLYAADEGFQELFKVKADFAPEMDWTAEHVHNYAAFISRCVQEGGLLHFDRGAVAQVVEHGARLRDHQHKLSTRLLDIADLVTEASFWAGKEGHEVVRAGDVAQAIAHKERRSNLGAVRVRELITDGTIMIATAGARVGQVNGLSVIELGDHTFGVPARVTARVALGRGTVRSIEREIELSGPIHSKGFLILSGYLAGTYAQAWPLALGATITFEQSYGAVEGDSASSTELYALLSALAEVPLVQAIAVTGSVNQYGEVQAVGGVTHKVEGFFAVCKAQGLSGEQGVLIPAANVQHLMLNDEVSAAVEAGRFHIWAVRTVDEGIELLTGRPAGERRQDGQYPEGSIHRLVEERLRRYAEQQRSFAASPNGAPDTAPMQVHSGQ